jgi:hypothetical protein
MPKAGANGAGGEGDGLEWLKSAKRILGALIVRCRGAARADKSTLPAPVADHRLKLLDSAVLLEEIKHRQPMLALHAVRVVMAQPLVVRSPSITFCGSAHGVNHLRRLNFLSCRVCD